MSQHRGRTANTVLSVLFLLLLAAAAVLYMFSEPLYEMQRAAAITEVLNVLDSGTPGVDAAADAFPVSGEEAAKTPLTADAAAFAGAEAAQETYVTDGRAALAICGVLSISKLNLRLPLFHGVSATALRFGAGMCASDDTGVTAIFGYRTRVSGRLLHDIDMLSEGDGLTVTRSDRVRTAYTVQSVCLVDADTLAATLAAPPEGCGLCIVSNNPAGATDGRIVVWLLPL